MLCLYRQLQEISAAICENRTVDNDHFDALLLLAGLHAQHCQLPKVSALCYRRWDKVPHAGIVGAAVQNIPKAEGSQQKGAMCAHENQPMLVNGNCDVHSLRVRWPLALVDLIAASFCVNICRRMDVVPLDAGDGIEKT